MAVISGPPPYPGERVIAAGSGAELGFFTDSSICIGCKACEVACKEWNHVPVDDIRYLNSSYDNTGELSETAGGMSPSSRNRRNGRIAWLMNSDVCKHCNEAACLDVCPTGALFRPEFDTVVVQEDVCNGCGYCIPACPFGVIGRREGIATQPATNGVAQKCTPCYDRLRGGLEPVCAHAWPNKSVQFGPLDELRQRAHRRLDALRQDGSTNASLYLATVGTTARAVRVPSSCCSWDLLSPARAHWATA